VKADRIIIALEVSQEHSADGFLLRRFVSSVEKPQLPIGHWRQIQPPQDNPSR
jgi:hypothetical protein